MQTICPMTLVASVNDSFSSGHFYGFAGNMGSECLPVLFGGSMNFTSSGDYSTTTYSRCATHNTQGGFKSRL